MTDAEWIALPLDVRMWCLDQARRCLVAAFPIPMPEDKLSEAARSVATVLLGPPPADEIETFEAGQDAPAPPARWRRERGLG